MDDRLDVIPQCADPLDVATVLAQKLNDSGIAKSAALAAPEQDGSITECVDCGNDLGGRVALFKVRCIRCQEILERKRDGYGLG
jgi:hypothetical protein